jgi:hypothetical protein
MEKKKIIKRKTISYLARTIENDGPAMVYMVLMRGRIWIF